MSYDLAIGPSNDLLFGANRDLLGVSGEGISEQRIRTRLKIKRGSWVFDTDGTLGSRIDRALGSTPNQAISEIRAFVLEALDDMEDVVVSDVEVEADPSDSTGTRMVVRVGYSEVESISEAPFSPPDEQINETLITFQL